MGKAIQIIMIIAINVVVIVALIWGSMVSRVENKQTDMDRIINTQVRNPSASGTCTGC